MREASTRQIKALLSSSYEESAYLEEYRTHLASFVHTRLLELWVNAKFARGQ